MNGKWWCGDGSRWGYSKKHLVDRGSKCCVSTLSTSSYCRPPKPQPNLGIATEVMCCASSQVAKAVMPCATSASLLLLRQCCLVGRLTMIGLEPVTKSLPICNWPLAQACW